MIFSAFTYYEGLASGSYSVLVVGDDGSAATSGQGTIDPVTGQRFTDPDDIEPQVRQVIANGKSALAKGGLTLEDVEYVSIYHVNPADKERILETLSASLESFNHEFIDASQLPGGQHVEIEFYTPEFRKLLETGVLKRESFGSEENDPVDAISRIMHQINDHLDDLGLSTEHIIQARITLPKGMLSKLTDVNTLYAGFFTKRYPIRSSSAGLDDITSIEIIFPSPAL